MKFFVQNRSESSLCALLTHLEVLRAEPTAAHLLGRTPCSLPYQLGDLR